MRNSRFKGLYRHSVAERIDALERAGFLTAEDAVLLRSGQQVLKVGTADRMIENVIGSFGLPLAVATNFVVNQRETLVPMVVEEASIVAGVSAAAALARASGGFSVASDESLLAGQIHLTGLREVDAALAAVDRAASDLKAAANAVHPRLVARGGGVIEVTARRLPEIDGAIVAELFVDTRDAMGANLVNTICEAIAPQIAEITGGDVALRILSNLTDRSVYRADVCYRLADLASTDFAAEAVRDRIIIASQIASADVHRAVTHNKGIMNGIDALAVATGNDWRAIEAGAHAFAARQGRYRPLAVWSAADNGDLLGHIEVPLKVGIVGGSLQSNPAVRLGLNISAVESANELAMLMAAVGLAQNFAAIRALATSGIQEGHMRLHARSVAAAAQVPGELFDQVVDGMIAADEIKVAKAQQILTSASDSNHAPGAKVATAAGKVILLGEHAVVYGKHALAIAIPEAVSASVRRADVGMHVSIPDWHYDRDVEAADDGVAAAVMLIADRLGIDGENFSVHIRSRLPRAMGLGSSAALAVAVVRAFGLAFSLQLDDARVNSIAFDCEKLAHGTPSGIDNTIATYAQALLFRNSAEPERKTLSLTEVPPLLIACGDEPGLTLEQVAAVRQRRSRFVQAYDRIFEQLDSLSIAAARALAAADYTELGGLMNIGHGLLNAIEVSTPELDRMVDIARAAGAAGAKMTGGGGGGSIVTLCPDRADSVAAALTAAGYRLINPAPEGTH